VMKNRQLLHPTDACMPHLCVPFGMDQSCQGQDLLFDEVTMPSLWQSIDEPKRLGGYMQCINVFH
jgi:hypothetical protein